MRAPYTEYTNDANIVKTDTVPDMLVKTDTVPDSIVKTDTVPISTWDLQNAKCILSMKSDCSIDVKGLSIFHYGEIILRFTITQFGR